MLQRFASSPDKDCNDLAASVIEYTCSRLRETVDDFMQQFTLKFASSSARRQLGALRCIASTVPFSDSTRLSAAVPYLLSVVVPSLHAEDPLIRTAAGAVFDRIGKQLGSRFVEDSVQSQLNDGSVSGLVELIRVRPEVALGVVFNRLSKRENALPFEVALIEQILDLEECEGFLNKYFDSISTFLLLAESKEVEGASHAFTRFAQGLAPAYTGAILQDFTRGMKRPETRASTLRSVAAFVAGVKLEMRETIEACLRTVLQAFADMDEAVVKSAVKALNDVALAIDEKAVAALPEIERGDTTNAKRAAGRASVQFLEVIQATIAATARSVLSAGESLSSLAIPSAFEAVWAFYRRGLDYGTTDQKNTAVTGMEDLLRFTPPRVVAANVVTVLGKCIKVLFEKNGRTPSLVQFCISKLNEFPNRTLENSMASTLRGIAISGFPEARTLGHELTLLILRRNAMSVAAMLNSAVKFNDLETPAQKASFCRHISVFVRHGKIEGVKDHVRTLMNFIMPLWQSVDQEASSFGEAAGSAVGALCSNVTIQDDEVLSITESAIAFIKEQGPRTLRGLACVNSILNASARLDADFCVQAAEAVKAVLPLFTTDVKAICWALRCVGTLCATSPSVGAVFHRCEPLVALLRIVDRHQDMLLSAAEHCITHLVAADPSMEPSVKSCYRAPSRTMQAIGCYDADVEEEANSTTLIW